MVLSFAWCNKGITTSNKKLLGGGHVEAIATSSKKLLYSNKGIAIFKQRGGEIGSPGHKHVRHGVPLRG